MRIALITNILTPYRKVFYDKLNHFIKKKNGSFKVLVMADSGLNRPWQYEIYQSRCSVLLKGWVLNIGNFDIIYNYNTAYKLKSFKPDILIIAGSWTYPTVWEILFRHKICPLSKHLIFWSESHRGEIRQKKNMVVSWVIGKLKKIIYKEFDSFWVPGKLAGETVDYICQMQKKKIFVPNLVEDALYKKAIEMRKNRNIVRSKYNIDIGNFVFICPARLTEVKGILPFLKNSKITLKEFNPTILIAGMGPLENHIRIYADSENLDVRLLGYKTQWEMVELYSLSDAFLLPSLSDPYPLSAIEASWAGLPLCLSKYTGNHPELVKEGINGFVFDTLNPKDTSIKIKKILTADKEWHRNAGKISHEIASASFEANKETKRIVDEMEHLFKTI